MFNFTTTNFINSALYTDGTAKYELVDTGTDGGHVYPVLNVNKNLMHFDYLTTEAIYWRAGDNGAKAKISSCEIKHNLKIFKIQQLSIVRLAKQQTK